jgi:protein-tyrosine phosphatase
MHYKFVDIHCHCLPGVDDGPATKAEALALCRALFDDCITTVIATPHQLGRYSGYNEAAQIREEVSILNEALKSNGIGLTVVPGADVRVDERIAELLHADKVLTLADEGKYILLELPHEIFIDVTPLLSELTCLGIHAIISHPERHSVLMQRPEILKKWLEQSAHLQVTSGSLLGGFGPEAQRAAWNFLTSGWASLVATDSHNTNQRKPCMKAAFERISVELGEDTARLVCIENPLRVIRSQDIIPLKNIPSPLSITTSWDSDDKLRSYYGQDGGCYK